MKKSIQLGLATTAVAALLSSCKTQQNGQTKMVLHNTSEIVLPQKAVEISRKAIANADKSTNFPILLHGNDTIPAQVNDLNGDGKWDEIFLVTDFSAKEKKEVELKWSETDPKFTVRTSVRFGKRAAKDQPVKPATEEILPANEVHKALGYQRYQTDGPTWENDKVGFRHYLDGRNAKDVFGKKTPGITPENVGINAKGEVEDDYHQMYDWGRDIFPVGNSVGLGGFGLLVDNQIKRLGILPTEKVNTIETTTFKIVSEGPENSVLSYDYHNWKVNDNLYQAHETTSIWPGMYGYQNTVSVDGLKGNEQLLIALSNINNTNPLQEVEAGDFVCLIQHGHLTYDKQWILGTAIIVPKKGYKGFIEAPKTGEITQSFLAKFDVKNNETVTYYAVAGWELSADPNFKDATYFANYVTTLAKQLTAKVEVKVN
ncbi:DUF4861 domain-containing protein [Flavobacterium agrisoli]|uniref:DUF4861 domain-containing protein n=1 Tax=Flavobacterium agrisoli TaxID=2793066 RepID=A0A934PLR9_9FLAO|nr:DUF4861 domain-containing protein [Flavobacterium agrisoli]MBK0369278.1 DUF4861 domain-containing protein [Flavobacterium agrisoli]